MRRPLLRGLLGAVLVTSAALVVLTLPARGGQNVDCRYGPIAEVSGLSHAELPEPVAISPGEARWLPLLLLSACAEPAQLTAMEPLNTRGAGAEVLEARVLPEGARVPDEGTVDLPASGDPIGTGPTLVPGEKRLLVVLLRGTGNGPFNLDAITVGYQTADGPGTFNFATFLGTCSPGPCQLDEESGD